MSWAEVFKINKNMKRSIDEQLQDMRCLPIRVITTTGTYTPEKTGLYKVICVGAGGNGTFVSSTIRIRGGGGGGVAIKTLKLTKGTAYNVTVSTTASFSNILSATGGAASTDTGSAASTGGTASGGDYNFTGEAGEIFTTKDRHARGGSVGVYITELSRSHVLKTSSTIMTFSGDCLLNYGGGGISVYDINNTSYTSTGFPAAIIIIPLEMEE